MTVETQLDPQQRLEAKNAFDGSLVFGTGHFNRRTGRDQHIDRRKPIRDYCVDADTGARLARASGRLPVEEEDLLRPRVNVALGAWYLGELGARFPDRLGQALGQAQ